MAISLKKISNPYSIFTVSWLLCLILYSFGWAEIFPPISPVLYYFLISCIITFYVTGIFFNKISLTKPGTVKVNYKILLIINAILYSVNFLYSGIPIIKGIRQEEFGIPTLIVLATTFNCFCSVYCFYLFLIYRKWKFILYSFFCLSFFIMVFSRGNIMMSIVTMFFLWINITAPKLSLKSIISIVSGVFLIVYLFGVAGNYRTINDLNNQGITTDNSYNSNVIMGLGGASASFKDSVVPGEFFWTYLYITSPLSNLQYNVNKNKISLSLTGVTHLFIDEVLFDTISKRIDNLLNRKRTDADLIIEQLTVPTTLAGSYNYAGWWGMAIFMFIFWLFPFFYTFLIIKNPLGIIGISTLCTVYFFSIFDNMFILTSLMLQIFFPIVLFFTSRITLTKPNSSI